MACRSGKENASLLSILRELPPRARVCYDARRMQSFKSKLSNVKKPARTGLSVTVGRAEEVPNGRGATVTLPDGRELALYNAGGEFFAIENFCPHKGAPLAEGTLCGHIIECDWHGWRFDIRTGRCLTSDDNVESYQVLIEDGWIKIII
ncbi:MAG: non-heme iron oxygenase ferredoxin subunit [Pyrinomonadaceae bacterium]